MPESVESPAHVSATRTGLRAAAARFLILFLSVVLLGCGTATSAQAGSSFYGLSAGFPIDVESPDNGVTYPNWDTYKNLGVGTQHVQFSWWEVQRFKNCPIVWDKYDALMRQAALRDMQILPYLYGGWVDSNPGNCSAQTGADPRFPRPGTQYYNDWVLPGGAAWQFVQRYGYKGTFWTQNPNLPYKPIQTWEVWNEPNLAVNNPIVPSSSATVHPDLYGKFLIAMADTIRNAQAALQPLSQTGTKVLTGGLYSPSGQWPFARFFRDLHSVNGVNFAYDGVSIHPYGFKLGIPNLAKADVSKDFITDARGWLDVNNQFPKTLWITEVGWPVAGVGGASPSAIVLPSEQAQLLADTFTWVHANRVSKRIKYLSWYAYRDLSASFSHGWDWYAGLLDANGNARASFWAYALFTAYNPVP